MEDHAREVDHSRDKHRLRSCEMIEGEPMEGEMIKIGKLPPSRYVKYAMGCFRVSDTSSGSRHSNHLRTLKGHWFLTLTPACPLLSRTFQERGMRTIRITAMGSAVGNCVRVAELLKARMKNALYQDTHVYGRSYKETWDPLEEGLDV